ncbi:hypothetical protein DE146DRAFT_637782 [Phaeosphaeria sp. MPI-PUGE-AT-0046c]|nr:hypothetical protein DE146DRAFT_637782 [Phaeosphaeria sp. MPI-PUGE-AT-0046c]
MPTLPSGVPRWADDDDDGTLDSCNVEALKARLREAEERLAADALASNVAASLPRTYAALTLRTRPLGEETSFRQTGNHASLQPGVGAASSTQSEATSQAPSTDRPSGKRNRRGKKLASRAQTGEGSATRAAPMATAHGVPLLPEGNDTGSMRRMGMDPAVWNAFAGEVSAAAAPAAAQIFGELRSEQNRPSKHDANAQARKQQKQRK